MYQRLLKPDGSGQRCVAHIRPYNRAMQPRGMFLRHRGVSVWQLLFCLTVFAFLGRAVIPAGYMPDSSDTRAGRFAITLCGVGPGAPSTLLVDLLSDAKQHAPEDATSAQDCVYGMVASE